MHEWSVTVDLLQQLERIAQEQHPGRITGVRLRLGALAHLSPAQLQACFALATRGTLLEGAQLQIEVLTDRAAPQAQAIVLDGVQVES
jgi:hydrogenase nickel incorporation protein HypA/HybF